MPAYFDLNLQFLRKDLHPGFLADFDVALERAGLEFADGFWEDAGVSREKIAAWNQQKLEADFCLGMTEHRSHDYKQTLYRFGAYSEVRGFWMNRYPADETFTWFLLIPEAEVLECNLTFQAGPVEELAELAKRLWQFPLVRAVQTELEGDGPSIAWKELRRGVPPIATPFAIVERDCRRYDDGSRVIELTRGRPGLLLLEEDDLPGPLIPIPGGGLLRLKEKNPN